MAKYSPKLPLSNAEDDTHQMLKTIKEVVKQNVKMVILTNPGERIMMPNFGVGIQQYLFENISQMVLEAAKQRISSQVEQFLPYVNIGTIQFNTNNTDPRIPLNTVHISISYSIPSLNSSDVLILELDAVQF